LCDLNPTLKSRVKFITSIAATSMAPVKPCATPDEHWEERIKLGLPKHHKENVPFKQLALEFNVVRTTLQDRTHGGATRKEAHAHQQKLLPSAEKALEDWCKQLDDWGFPPRIDLLKAMALVLAAQRAVEENNPDLAKLGKHWIANFLDRHPTLAAKYSAQLDRQRAMANNAQSLGDYFRK
jgi:hypothetical protein